MSISRWRLRGLKEGSKGFLIGLVVLALFSVVLAMNAEAQEKSILRWAIDWPNAIDPSFQTSFSDMQSCVNLYSSLVYPKPGLAGGVEPHVAESWGVSKDALTWTFHLKRGIRFSDGSELDAEDVKFSMDRMLALGSGFAYLWKGLVKGVEVVDKYTVKFHLDRPYGPFISTLIKFYTLNKDEVMKHLKKPGPFGDFGDYGKEWLVTHSAGSGAYMVKEFIVTDYLLMEKNPYYSFYRAPKAPDLAKMTNTIESATAQMLIKNRELEISDFWQSDESFSVMAKIPHVDIIGFDVGRAGFFEMHTKIPPTDDLHFRRAVCWAFDYASAMKLFPGAKQARGPVPHVIPGWNPNVFQYRFDLNKAKEELAKSKYAKELDKYPVEIEYWMPNASNERMALLLQANLSKIGVKSKLSPEPVSRALDRCGKKETTPNVMFFEIACEFPEAGGILNIHLHSRNAGRYENTNWLEDPEVDKLVDKALATLDQKERFALYHKLQEKAVDLALDIHLYDRFQRQAVQQYLKWPRSQQKNVIPSTGFDLDVRFIEVFPEKRAEILKK